MRLLQFASLATVCLANKGKDGKDEKAARGDERGQYPAHQTPNFNLSDRGRCSKSLDSSSGIYTIESRHSYDNHENCHIMIECPANEAAFFKVERIDIENHGSCYYDYLKLSWMDRQTGSVTTDHACGTNSHNSVHHADWYSWKNTNARKFIVDFYTDYSVVNYGFKLQVNCVDMGNFDECAEGMHECHADAICTDEENGYSCACKNPQFYDGDGFNCEFRLGSKFLIDHYRHTLRISDRYVRSEIAMVIENKNNQDLEIYDFGVNLDPLEFISGLTIRVGDNGPVSSGDVHLEQEAQEIFDNAVSGGQGAALTTQDQETNRETTFSTQVAIPAGGKLYVWLNYDMQLERTLKNYKYKTPVYPYDPVSLMEIVVDIEESRPLKTGQTYVWWESREKHVTDGPMTFDKTVNSNGHYTYRFIKENVGADEFNEKVKVEYDVARPSEGCGDIVLRDGYFVHYIAPENVDPLPKNVILTVDVSGSMGTTRMNNAKEAMKIIMNDLNENDTFWLQSFDGSTYYFRPEALLATPGNVAMGIQWISGLRSGGMTNLYSATYNSVHRPLDPARANIVFIISDGAPTAGETNWETIQRRTREENERPDGLGQKWAIFTFGIGNGAPMQDLGKLSAQNMGLARQVFDDADVQDVLSDFFEEYATPLIWNNKFDYQGVTSHDCSSTNLYADQELVCIGRLQDACTAPNLDVSGAGQLLAEESMYRPNKCKVLDKGKCGTEPEFDAVESLMDNPIPRSKYVSYQKVYAYQKMRKDLKLYHATYYPDEREAAKQQISDFAVANDFVTEFTSLVVVQAQVRKRRSREKQLAIRALFDEYNKEVSRLEANDSIARSRRSETSLATAASHSKMWVLIAIFGLLSVSQFRRFASGARRMRFRF